MRYLALFVAFILTVSGFAADTVFPLDCEANARARVANALVNAKVRDDAYTNNVNFQITKWALTGLDPASFGFLAEAEETNYASILSGSANLAAPTGTFSSDDVGKTIYVQGAGVGGASLVTTISSFSSDTAVTLASLAGTTVSASKTSKSGIAVWGWPCNQRLEANPRKSVDGKTLFYRNVNDSSFADIKSFGAVGDGIVDDSSAFNVAVASGKNIELSPGTYKISNVVMGSAITVHGAPGSFLKPKDSSPMFIANGSEYPARKGYKFESVYFKSNPLSRAGIAIWSKYALSIESCVFEGFSYAVVTHGEWDVVRNSQFIGNEYAWYATATTNPAWDPAGIPADGQGNPSEKYFSDVWFQGNSYCYVEAQLGNLFDQSCQLVFKNCQFMAAISGITNVGGEGHILLDSCWIEGTTSGTGPTVNGTVYPGGLVYSEGASVVIQNLQSGIYYTNPIYVKKTFSPLSNLGTCPTLTIRDTFFVSSLSETIFNDYGVCTFVDGAFAYANGGGTVECTASTNINLPLKLAGETFVTNAMTNPVGVEYGETNLCSYGDFVTTPVIHGGAPFTVTSDGFLAENKILHLTGLTSGQGLELYDGPCTAGDLFMVTYSLRTTQDKIGVRIQTDSTVMGGCGTIRIPNDGKWHHYVSVFYAKESASNMFAHFTAYTIADGTFPHAYDMQAVQIIKISTALDLNRILNDRAYVKP